MTKKFNLMKYESIVEYLVAQNPLNIDASNEEASEALLYLTYASYGWKAQEAEHSIASLDETLNHTSKLREEDLSQILNILVSEEI